MNLAFFDVDQTLYDGYCTRQCFYYVAQKRGLTQLINERKACELRVKNNTLNQHQATGYFMDLAARAIAGLSIEEVELLTQTIVKTEGKFFPWVNPVMQYLIDRQFRIYLVSAAIEPMIFSIAQQLKVEHYFATTLEVTDGVYTGSVTHLRNSHAKAEKIAELIKEIAEDNNVIAFGDGPGDIPMLRVADQAFVVSPVEFTEVILAEAKKHQWPILKHETAFEQVKQQLSDKFDL